MDPLEIIQKYYPPKSKAFDILFRHSRAVADKALEIAQRHAELQIDVVFLEEAALLHDIGIYLTDAPDLGCHGKYPYICHGYLGRELLEKEGFPFHALVCERHTGTGLTLKDIKDQELPIPLREMMPRSLEEEVICFADKFFSKSKHHDKELPIKKARNRLLKHGEKNAIRFDNWCHRFL